MVTRIKTTLDVAALVRDAGDGDSAALDDLITAHLPLIYNIVGRAVGPHPDVDDIVQETMLRAVRGLPTLREPGLFRSWLVAIAYRQIQQYFRSRRAARLRHLIEPVEVPDPRGDVADHATAGIVVADQRRELVEAARWLDDGDRQLLGLWWQEALGELTRTELADVIAVPAGHAAVRVQRMKAQLDTARGIVRALRAKPRCAGLESQLRRWNGAADPLWRKRLARHVRECAVCATHRADLVAPEGLLLGIAALPVPVALLAGLPNLAGAGAPVKVGLLGLLPHKAVAAVATTVAIGGGLVYAVHHESLPPGGGPVVAAPTLTRTAVPGTTPPRPATTAPAAPSASPTSRAPALSGAGTADIYVATTGSDAGDGSAAKPYATIAKAVSVVRPGQRIMLTNYRNERPVIDASGIPAGEWAVVQRTSYWTVQGLEVINAPSHAYVCLGCRNNVFRRLSMHDNTRSGLMLRDPGTTGNQVLDSDFFRNRDPGGARGVGVGLCVQFGAGTGNVVRGNRAFGNGAAGYETGGFADAVTFDRNWAYDNGGNGFVLAGGGAPNAGGGAPTAGDHVLRHNAAWSNGGHGFADDSAGGAVRLTNNTAYRNGGNGFDVGSARAQLSANVSVGEVSLSGDAALSGNSWQTTGWDTGDLRSTDPAGATGSRRADGTLPRTAFLATGNGMGASLG